MSYEKILLITFFLTILFAQNDKKITDFTIKLVKSISICWLLYGKRKRFYKDVNLDVQIKSLILIQM